MPLLSFIRGKHKVEEKEKREKMLFSSFQMKEYIKYLSICFKIPRHFVV
jgi:hypothetical protein